MVNEGVVTYVQPIVIIILKQKDNKNNELSKRKLFLFLFFKKRKTVIFKFVPHKMVKYPFNGFQSRPSADGPVCSKE